MSLDRPTNQSKQCHHEKAFMPLSWIWLKKKNFQGDIGDVEYLEEIRDQQWILEGLHQKCDTIVIMAAGGSAWKRIH